MNPGSARTYLLTALVGLLCAAGCVPNSKLREAENANRILEQQNRTLESRTEEIRAQLTQARAEIDDLQIDLDRRRSLNINYKSSLDLMESERDRLKELYEAAITDNRPPPINITVLPAKLDQALKQFAGEYPDMIEYVAGRGMIKFKSDLTFAKGSAETGTEAREALLKFAEILQGQEAQQFMVVIAGHTDNIPIKRETTKRHHPNNWFLSVHRALSVQHFLTRVGRFSPERIAVMGFGEHHPVVPNKPNEGGNPANRRVEIWIVPPGQFLTESAVAGDGPRK